MNTRLKYLVFLGIFLTGSFLIVTWKSFDIFSKKYAQTYQNMQIQDLEKQALVVQSQFDNLQKILREQNNVEPMLKSQGIALLAHIIKENGKWKAQWFEGVEGLRSQAKNVAQQIPFDSLSTSKKTWHLVNVKDQGAHLAYVIPVFDSGKVSYYSFFFKSDFLTKWFRSSSTAENFTLIAPQVGEIFNLGEKPIEGLEKYRSALTQKHAGLLPISKTVALVTYFHPDLQLTFVKQIQLQNMVVESVSYLRALMLMIGLLVMISLVVSDLVLRSFFQRIEDLEVQAMKQPPSQILAEPTIIAEVPRPVAPVIETKETVKDTTDMANLRAKAINCLGYLNRYKTQNPAASSQLQLLEKELRELRVCIDPVEPISVQSPLSKSTNLDPISSDFDVQSLLTSIRKPKREKHESQKV